MYMVKYIVQYVHIASDENFRFRTKLISGFQLFDTSGTTNRFYNLQQEHTNRFFLVLSRLATIAKLSQILPANVNTVKKSCPDEAASV